VKRPIAWVGVAGYFVINGNIGSDIPLPAFEERCKQTDGLRKSTGQYPGKDMPAVFESVPGKEGFRTFAE
jgi:hypothetical protein